MTSQPVAVLSDDTIQALIRLPNIQASFEGETCANYLGGETDILYSTPVYTGGEVTEVLIGVRLRERMQAMIASKRSAAAALAALWIPAARWCWPPG